MSKKAIRGVSYILFFIVLAVLFVFIGQYKLVVAIITAFFATILYALFMNVVLKEKVRP